MSRSAPEPRVAALAVAGARKRYGDAVALRDVTLAVAPGEWRGLVGPNGAGKTTLLLAAAGLLPLDGGAVELFGRPVSGPRPDAVGWVPQEIALYGALTARENLATFGRLHGLARRSLADRVAWALDWSGLGARADDRVERFSGGMRRRLNLACGVLHEPRVLLLDEPTVGVDPQARERIVAMLDELRASGAALLQSSHELGDLEDVCDALTVMDDGRVVGEGTVAGLVAASVGDHALVTLSIEGLAGEIPGLARASDGRTYTARLEVVADGLPALLDAIRERGGRVVRLDLRRPGLREVFAELTGRELEGRC